MIIKRVVLRNYRRFASAEMECPENIIGIIGRNGAGKTSLVEAIGWALYGNVIARTGKSDIRSQFAPLGESCSVELVFTYGGEEYRILRQLKGKNAIAEAALYQAASEEPLAVQERGVNEYVERLLRLDYRSFFASVFARQRELAALSAMSPEERRKSIARLINIDRIDQARERVLSDRLGKSRFIEGLARALIDLDSLEQKIAFVNGEAFRLRTALEEENKSVEACQAILLEARTQLERLTRLRDTWQAHEGRISGWHASRSENNAALLRCREDLASIHAAAEELTALRGETDELPTVKQEKERLDGEELRQVQRDSLVIQQTQARQQVNACRERIAVVRGLLEGLADLEQHYTVLLQQEGTLERELDEARAAQQHWQSESSAISKAGTQTRSQKEQIEKLGPDGECPTCTQRLEGHYLSVLGQLEDKLGEMRQNWQMAAGNLDAAAKKVAEKDQALRDMRKEKEALLQQVTANRTAAGALEQLQRDEEEAAQRLAAAEKELADLGKSAYDRAAHSAAKKRLTELEALRRRADQLEERASRRLQVAEEITRIEKVLAEFTRLIEHERELQTQLGFAEQAYQAAAVDLKTATSDVIAAQERHAAIREDLARSAAAEEALQAQKVEQQQKRLEIASAEKELLYLDALEIHLRKFRVDLAGRIRPMIARRASTLLGLTTNGRYSRLELDEDYQISICDGNQPFPLGRFSGGEQDLANLCLRVAISQILAERSGGAPINFIVLDEIFGSQDEERKTLILNALGQLASQFRQIFIITHVDSIKDLLPVIVEVSLIDEQQSQVRTL